MSPRPLCSCGGQWSLQYVGLGTKGNLSKRECGNYRDHTQLRCFWLCSKNPLVRIWVWEGLFLVDRLNLIELVSYNRYFKLIRIGRAYELSPLLISYHLKLLLYPIYSAPTKICPKPVIYPDIPEGFIYWCNLTHFWGWNHLDPFVFKSTKGRKYYNYLKVLLIQS